MQTWDKLGDQLFHGPDDASPPAQSRDSDVGDRIVVRRVGEYVAEQLPQLAPTDDTGCAGLEVEQEAIGDHVSISASEGRRLSELWVEAQASCLCQRDVIHHGKAAYLGEVVEGRWLGATFDQRAIVRLSTAEHDPQEDPPFAATECLVEQGESEAGGAEPLPIRSLKFGHPRLELGDHSDRLPLDGLGLSLAAALELPGGDGRLRSFERVGSENGTDQEVDRRPNERTIRTRWSRVWAFGPPISQQPVRARRNPPCLWQPSVEPSSNRRAALPQVGAKTHRSIVCG